MVSVPIIYSFLLGISTIPFSKVFTLLKDSYNDIPQIIGIFLFK